MSGGAGEDAAAADTTGVADEAVSTTTEVTTAHIVDTGTVGTSGKVGAIVLLTFPLMLELLTSDVPGAADEWRFQNY